MKKVSDSVKEIVATSEMAQEAIRRGCLNYHAYAAEIRSQVESLTWKPVKIGSIVVALSRFQAEIKASPALKPNLQLLDLHINLPLSDMTYEKNQQTTRAIQLLYSVVNFQVDYFMVTYGLSEITLICSQNLVALVKEHFRAEPSSELHNLVGVTVNFDTKYLQEPNVIYTILSSLAVKKINIREIISTNTTLTMVIDEHNLELVLAQLKSFFGKKVIT